MKTGPPAKRQLVDRQEGDMKLTAISLLLSCAATSAFAAAPGASPAAAAPAAATPGIDLGITDPACPEAMLKKNSAIDPAPSKCTVDSFGRFYRDDESKIEFYFGRYSFTPDSSPNFSRNGVAVIQRTFDGPNGGSTDKVVHAEVRDNGGVGDPVVYETTEGTLLVIPRQTYSDVAPSDDLVFLLADGQLQPVKPFQWVDDLLKRKAMKGNSAYRNPSPDYQDMTALIRLWADADSICCPSSMAFVGLHLKGNALVLGNVYAVVPTPK